MILSALLRIQGLFNSSMPGLSIQEQQLIVLIADAQRTGNALNMKQIVFSQGESATTVRRRVARLEKLGYVQKKSKENDGRSFVYTVADCVLQRLLKLTDPLKDILKTIDVKHVKQQKSI